MVPIDAMPADELGEIMRSRNRSISALRRHEADLAAALQRIEEVATDLKRKNHLLETARQNLADADRLASLGIMSAGLAHELNTPLAVIKGLAEKLHADATTGESRRSLSAVEAALMLRVVGRLERLSESLLDFARARPPRSRQTVIRPLVDEASTLVRLDREAAAATILNAVAEDLTAWCDGDRIVQVLVNLLRNAVDAARSRPSRARPAEQFRIEVTAAIAVRDGRRWVSITIADNGPGIDPEVLPRLFQPFATTRLDSRGTGLGLATSEGIVREHGGVLLAHNRVTPDGRIAGAEFEIVLPAEATA
jgi:two-component system C4-dicarboxylate transport sensor histidine kinase DctB